MEGFVRDVAPVSEAHEGAALREEQLAGEALVGLRALLVAVVHPDLAGDEAASAVTVHAAHPLGGVSSRTHSSSTSSSGAGVPEVVEAHARTPARRRNCFKGRVRLQLGRTTSG